MMSGRRLAASGRSGSGLALGAAWDVIILVAFAAINPANSDICCDASHQSSLSLQIPQLTRCDRGGIYGVGSMRGVVR